MDQDFLDIQYSLFTFSINLKSSPVFKAEHFQSNYFFQVGAEKLSPAFSNFTPKIAETKGGGALTY